MDPLRIALVAPPFIAVPPKKYGGTELFIAELAVGLQKEGMEVIVYTNGESSVDAPTRWIYERGEWPLNEDVEASLKGINHSAWAIHDAARDADIIHLNSAPGISLGRFVDIPMVYTIHHDFDASLSRYYQGLPDIAYVAISHYQRRKLKMPHARTIHHGIDASLYRMSEHKQPYLAFLGRIAPEKGTHLAIEIARESGIPLKIAGEIQPCFREYWESKIKPKVDGRFIQYVGETNMAEKNELLGGAMAMLFPVEWDEPFGLVMIEAMACGTPVLALGGGSVEEIVKEGIAGRVRRNARELARCVRDLNIPAATVRGYVEQFFSAERMARDYVTLYKDLVYGQAVSATEDLVA